MKRTILVALVITASIGSQVNLSAAAATGSTKLGFLTFALTDTYQGPSSRGVRTNPGNIATTNTVPALLECAGAYKYQSSVIALNNASVLRAISTAFTGVDFKQVGGAGNGVFTAKAKIVIWNYDNVLPAPPYPPYLPQLDGLPAADTMNGPLIYNYDITTSTTEYDDWVDWALNALSPLEGTWQYFWVWPNLEQIDWVDYDGLASRQGGGINNTPAVFPEAQVFVSDPSNGNALYQCVNVSPFFSFEEAYCYFCWDTVDRVTDGTFGTGALGEICIGSSCATKGAGTTRWYMTIKFSNNDALNTWLNTYGPTLVAAAANVIAPWLPSDLPYAYPQLQTPSGQGEGSILVKPLPIEAWLQFSVGGVVVYPWQFKTVQGVYGPFGTMTMAQANGFGNNPWCGVLVGSVKIAEGTDIVTPICVDTINWPPPDDVAIDKATKK
jgi:hypothetical protein